MTFGRESDEAESHAVLARFVEAGGSFLDTADAYAMGVSESIIGSALASRPGLRDNLVIATKFRRRVGADPKDVGASRRHIRRSVEASLRRLGTDWIDLYQIHTWDPRTPLVETLSTLDALVREGKVRYLGASNHAGWQLATALGLAGQRGWEPYVSLQAEYSLLSRGAERELLPLCDYAGLALMPWSPLAGGVLTGKYRQAGASLAGSRATGTYPQSPSVGHRLADARTEAVVATVLDVARASGHTPAQVALGWVLAHDVVTSPVIGARTVAQLEEALGALGADLDAEHLRALDAASAFELGYPYTSLVNAADNDRDPEPGTWKPS